MADQPAAGTINVQEATKLLMFDSPRRVQQLAEEGWIEKAERGRYNTISVVQGYIRFLQQERKNQQQNVSQNKMRDAKAREIELRVAQAEHELVELDEVIAVLDIVTGDLRAAFNGFGAEMTRDIPFRRKIEHGIDAIFDRATKSISEKVAALRESGEAVDPDTPDDT